MTKNRNTRTSTNAAATVLIATLSLALTACGPSKVEEDTAAMRQIMEKQEREKALKQEQRDAELRSASEALRAEQKKRGY